MGKFQSSEWGFTDEKLENLCAAVDDVTTIANENDVKIEVTYTDDLICFDLYVIALIFTDIQELQEWKALNQIVDCVEIIPSTKYEDRTIMVSFQFRADKKISK